MKSIVDLADLLGQFPVNRLMSIKNNMTMTMTWLHMPGPAYPDHTQEHCCPCPFLKKLQMTNIEYTIYTQKYIACHGVMIRKQTMRNNSIGKKSKILPKIVQIHYITYLFIFSRRSIQRSFQCFLFPLEKILQDNREHRVVGGSGQPQMHIARIAVNV